MSLINLVWSSDTVDTVTAVLATGAAAWAASNTKALALVAMLPLLLLPSWKAPFLEWLPGGLANAANKKQALVILATLIALRQLHKRRSPPPEFYLVDPLIGRKFSVVGHKTHPTLADIPTLVAEMRQVFEAGLSRPLAKRLEQLLALKRFFVENEVAICNALKLDLGRPTFEALYYDNLLPLHEIDSAIANLGAWTAPTPVRHSLIVFPGQQSLVPEPLGVSLIISTWNYPVMLSLVPAIGAIAAGNVVILKPCVVAPNTAKLLATLLPKYMDPRILSVVGADFDRDSPCTHALLQEKTDVIFFTGSPTVGKVIMTAAAQHLTPCILELGGKNPVFVDADADLSLAAKRIVWGRNMNAGQQCISPDYVLVHEAAIDSFCAHAAHWVTELYGPEPKTAGNVGRIVGAKQFERLAGLLASHGGSVVAGGVVDAKERYISPSVIRVAVNSPLMEEEIFGPILAVVPFKNVKEAVAFVNARPKPLSLYIFSNNVEFQQTVVQNTSSGGVTINATLLHVGHPDLPFGGVGSSGFGAYHGKYTFDAFSHHKPVLNKFIWKDGGLLSDPFFLYPPWTSAKTAIVRTLMKFI